MLPIHIANIKSSGVYRFVFDKSEVSNTIPQTLRLVVGYSEKGPFNTVTYVKNEGEFREIYGGISKKLEKYGCFFHRLALQCLAKEPVLCLNLKKFKPKSSSTDVANTDYEAVTGFTFGAYGSTAISTGTSIEVEKIFNTSRLWTLDPEVLPDAFNTSNYISIVQTDSKKCSDTVYIRPSLAKGFDVTLRDWYNNYNNGEYPEYAEKWLDTLVSDYLVDVYIFRGQFTTDIATSDTFINYFTVNGSDVYVKDYIENAFGEKTDALQALSEVDGSGFIARYTGSLIPYFKNIDGSWMSIDLVVNNSTDTHNVMMYLDENQFEKSSPITLQNINLGGWFNNFTLSSLGTLTSYYGTDNKACYMYNIWKYTSANDTGKWELDGSSKNDFTYGTPAIDLIPVEDTTVTGSSVTVSGKDSIPVNIGDKFVGSDGSEYYLTTVVDITPDTDTDATTITFTNKPYTVEDSTDSESDTSTLYLIKYNHKLSANAGTLSTAFDNKSHKGIYLEGYTYLSGKPKATAVSDKINWINGQLDVLKNKGLREALTNGTDTEYRYIIDTFEGFPEDELRSRLSLLAKEKENAFVISNFPAIKTLAKMGAWSDDKNGFSTKYVATGHNRAKSTPFNISMPSDSNGASFVGFFTPLKFNDNGIKIDVPSAALVSNNFMDKYSSRQPYYVVAGPSYGRMSYTGMIGPDYNFTREDLDNLEPMGVNCMVYKPQRGTFINSNQTAKQNPVTGLSKINIRELVIYLQDTIADMLQGYQWELNTATLRGNIKAKADAICEAVMSNGGLYDYLNVCDESNNTPEVIDNECVILSTSIEPAKGAGKMVHELTIYRTGGMSSIIK